MKRFLLSIIALFAILAVNAQDCTYLFISEYVEGTANSKGVEIYNPTNTAIDLSDYLIVRYSNGSASASEGYKTDLIGTIQPYSTFVLVNGQTTSSETSPACDPVFQAMADQLDGEYPAPMYMNGNDAITLETKDGLVWDIFGKVGEDPGTGWCDVDSLNYVTGATYWWLAWSKDHTLRRKPEVKHGVFINPGAPGSTSNYFDVSQEWDTVPGYWSAIDTAWVSANIWDGIGSHDCECDPNYNSVGTTLPVEHNAFFFPNPSDGKFTIKANAYIESIEIMNALGQRIYTNKNDMLRGDIKVDLEKPNTGLYFVKIHFTDNTSMTKKIIVK